MIHPTAKVHPTARLGTGVVLGPDVTIGENVYIGSYSVIGGVPEHRAFYDDMNQFRTKGVIIEADAKIFEFVTIHAGTALPTIIGSRSSIFNHSHIAHDCFIESGVTIGGHASLAGHVRVQEGANLSGRCNVHQWQIIGAYSFLAASAFLNRDLPPGEKWIGIPARPAGYNEIGLSRTGITIDECRRKFMEGFELWKRQR